MDELLSYKESMFKADHTNSIFEFFAANWGQRPSSTTSSGFYQIKKSITDKQFYFNHGLVWPQFFVFICGGSIKGEGSISMGCRSCTGVYTVSFDTLQLHIFINVDWKASFRLKKEGNSFVCAADDFRHQPVTHPRERYKVLKAIFMNSRIKRFAASVKSGILALCNPYRRRRHGKSPLNRFVHLY